MIAVVPSQLIRHRRSLPHYDRTVTEDFVNRLIQSQDLFLRDYFDPTEVPEVPVPGIKWSDGFQCGVRNCTHTTTSRATMGRHMIKMHHSSIREIPPSDTCVQIIFESNDRRYSVDVSAVEQPSLSSVSSPFALLLDQIRKTSAPLPLAIPDDPAVLNPILATYHWMEALQGLLTKDIKILICLPARGEKLEATICAVNKYYQRISKEMGHLDVHTTTLRWINSTKE